MRRAIGTVLTLLAAYACGARLDLPSTEPVDAAAETASPASNGGAGGTIAPGGGASPGAGRGASTGTGGAVSGHDAGGDLRDASADGSPRRDAQQDGALDAAPARDATHERTLDASLRDVTADAPAPTFCACPPADYFLDAVIGGVSVHLTSPYPLFVYCEEMAVQLAHPDCGDVYRLSACAGPGYERPCLYIAIDRSRGPLLGHWVDVTGQTFDLLTAEIDPGVPRDRVTEGAFSATFSGDGDGEATLLSVAGTFRACAPILPPCTP